MRASSTTVDTSLQGVVGPCRVGNTSPAGSGLGFAASVVGQTLVIAGTFATGVLYVEISREPPF